MYLDGARKFAKSSRTSAGYCCKMTFGLAIGLEVSHCTASRKCWQMGHSRTVFLNSPDGTAAKFDLLSSGRFQAITLPGHRFANGRRIPLLQLRGRGVDLQSDQDCLRLGAPKPKILQRHSSARVAKIVPSLSNHSANPMFPFAVRQVMAAFMASRSASPAGVSG